MFSGLQGQMQGSGYRFRTLNVLKLLYLFSMIVQYEKSVKSHVTTFPEVQI